MWPDDPGLAHSQGGAKQAARQDLAQAIELKSNFEGADEMWELLRSLG